jgi:dolichol-phosphate mannosyltransferase
VDLYNKYRGGCDLVYAQRKQRKGESFFKKLTAMFFYRLLKILLIYQFPLIPETLKRKKTGRYHPSCQKR